MMTQVIFYLCPKCFEVREVSREEHRHRMLRCEPGDPGSERRKPPVDARGHLMTRAPRWYLEALGVYPHKG
jgi:hypothetical protein